MKLSIQKELGRNPRLIDYVYCFMFKIGIQVILMQRISFYFFSIKRTRFLSSILNYLISLISSCYIGKGSKIGRGIYLPHPTGIVIGEGVIIGNDVTIYQHVTLGKRKNTDITYPIIGDRVVIYSGACIVGDISIGDDCIIGANAVVISSMPKNSVIVGSPARVIKHNDVNR
jgi:serine O-acetyltransferase